MQLATTHQIPVVPRGGASNCSAGMMPNQDRILLDLRNMNRVLDIDVAARRACVQPGAISAALQRILRYSSCEGARDNHLCMRYGGGGCPEGRYGSAGDSATWDTW